MDLLPREFMLKFDHKKAGLAIRQLVADAVSTEGTIFGIDDVDFLPTMYPPGTQVSAPLSFEIETIGYTDRKAKLREGLVQQLKSDIIKTMADGPYGVELDPDKPLIWLKFQDPDGLHI